MSTPKLSHDDFSITIKQFAEEIMPKWKPDEWFIWPPDVFALTSMLLKRTGIYRYAVSPYPYPGAKPKRCIWLDKNNEAAKTSLEWYKWILGLSDVFPESLQKSKEILFDEKNKLNLYDYNLPPETCTAILHLHAVADTACANFGLPSATGVYINQIHFLANTLLGLAGTLSRLPKRHGVVLPKMRAPQSGLTLRSFSHHLTFHQSEMDIHWRTIPWNYQDYSAVNIMVIPMPYIVKTKSFRACVDYPGREKDAKNYDYFEYASEEPLDVSGVIALLKKAHKELNRVHLIVFPEAALTHSDLDNLKTALQSEIKSPHLIPMVLTGIRGGKDRQQKRNQVVLSTFFANKWYDLRQDKHHRWKLEKGQITRYSLAESLNVESQWWEGIDLRDRSLTFLAPNGWLTLCPLICEDLAQLEPVSELIRGVGPTLLVAILMDGPQLTHRWSARYSGVFADDPGTSVLTVTSLGMAIRSRELGKPEDRTVALWKDQETGWAPIELDKGAGAILLTISAKWKEEFTADGRSDHGNAATFILSGRQQLKVSGKEKQNARRSLARRQKDDSESSKSTDVLELSIMSYLVDIFMDIPNVLIERIKNWAIAAEENAEAGADDVRKTLKPFDSLERRLRVGIEMFAKRGRSWPPNEYKYGVEQLARFISEENLSVDFTRPDKVALNCKLERWKRLVEKANAALALEQESAPSKSADSKATGVSPSDRKRLNRLVYLSILWAIHNRLENLQQDRKTHLVQKRPNSKLKKSLEGLLEYTQECQERYSGYQEV
jgi:hypothetical protein